MLSSCVHKSFLQKNSYLLGPQNKIRTDGIYYSEGIVRRESATEYQGIPYFKFFGQGYYVMGISMNIDALNEKYFQNILSAKQKSYSYFIVRNDTLFREFSSGYNSFYEYEVYKIISPDTLIAIGTTRKIGKKIKKEPAMTLTFKKIQP